MGCAHPVVDDRIGRITRAAIVVRGTRGPGLAYSWREATDVRYKKIG